MHNASSPSTLHLNGTTTLVTGAAGTIGGALVEVIARYGARPVGAFDHGESEPDVFERPRDDFPVTPAVGDIRDFHRLPMAMSGVDMVFHATAPKHIEVCECPFDVVETNFRGRDNVVRASLDSSESQG